MGATHLGTLRGFIEAAHLLQGNARWVIFLGGSCIRASFVDGVSQCRKKIGRSGMRSHGLFPWEEKQVTSY